MLNKLKFIVTAAILCLFMACLKKDVFLSQNNDNPYSENFGFSENLFYQHRAEKLHIDMQRKKINKLISFMKIKPGSVILDIGAGTGQFSALFAQKVKNKGAVYATDIERECIEYIKNVADKNNLSALYPVLVKEKGLDEFYTQNNYDIITV